MKQKLTDNEKDKPYEIVTTFVELGEQSEEELELINNMYKTIVDTQ